MEENNNSLFRFVDYLDSYKHRSMTAIDYVNLFHATNVNYFAHEYYDANYCGEKFKRVYNNPFLPVKCATNKNSKSESADLDGVTIEPLIKKEIDVQNVRQLRDLVALIEQYPIAEPGVEYNIDLASLIRIKEELVELEAMIGMSSLKTSIMDQLLYFLQRLHVVGDNDATGLSQGFSADLKHTVIYGPPGTGKTEVAKLIGRMYSKLGILKNGVFKKATRHDMVAGYLGQTALKTKALIKECLGGVLFIDEAYSLGAGSIDRVDSFSKECIDTLCESLSDEKNDLMVIIAGYQTELEEQFFSANPGLESRFIWRFSIESYTSKELFEIFRKKVGDVGWTLYVEEEAETTSDKPSQLSDWQRLSPPESVRPVAKLWEKWFNANYKEFTSFGRDMEALLFYAKVAHSKRMFGKPKELLRLLTREDVEAGYQMYLKNRKMKKKDADEKTRRILETMYT